MLEQAIVDAEALKEAAYKNAEAMMIEKYSGHLKDAISQLLEADGEEEDMELDMPVDLGGGDDEETGEPDNLDVPSAATEGEKLCPCPDEDEIVEINLDDVAAQANDAADAPTSDEFESSEDIAGELSDDDELQLTEAALMQLLDETTYGEDDTDDDAITSASDKDFKTGVESGTVDKIVKKRGEDLDDDEEQKKRDSWLDEQADETVTSDLEVVSEEETDDEDVTEENTELKEQVANLNKKLGSMQNKNVKLNKLARKLGNKLDELNLNYARLLYTNKALTDLSLNERQKKVMVKSLSQAKSIEEAKVLFEALQSQVSTPTRNKNESLDEVIKNRNTGFLPRKQQDDDSTLIEHKTAAARWQVLAGIKK
tara:strand:+ start:15114 stop:16223 length:1110 start_codon:yes stop_codon:yes gene_type:complete